MPSSVRSYAREVAGGLASLLAANGLATWDEWEEGAAYTEASVFPVFIGPDMPSLPHRLIVITPSQPVYVRADVSLPLQIRLRGLPYDEEDGDTTEDALALHAQRIHDLLYPNGFPLVHVNLGSVRVGKVQPISESPLGFDGNRRAGHTINVVTHGRRTAVVPVIRPPLVVMPDPDDEGYFEVVQP